MITVTTPEAPVRGNIAIGKNRRKNPTAAAEALIIKVAENRHPPDATETEVAAIAAQLPVATAATAKLTGNKNVRAKANEVRGKVNPSDPDESTVMKVALTVTIVATVGIGNVAAVAKRSVAPRKTKSAKRKRGESGVITRMHRMTTRRQEEV